MKALSRRRMCPANVKKTQTENKKAPLFFVVPFLHIESIHCFNYVGVVILLLLFDKKAKYFNILYQII